MSTNEEKNKMSRTDEDQYETENSVLDCFLPHNFKTYLSENFSGEAKYLKKLHYEFAKKLMSKLPIGYMSLDSGYPWFCYWITNILEMTKDKYDLSYDTKLKFVEMLKELQHPDGGFCGMPKGYAHLISTYSAMMAIVNLGIKEAYDIVDIMKMKEFLIRMKNNHFNIKDKPSYIDKNGVFLIYRNENEKNEENKNENKESQNEENKNENKESKNEENKNENLQKNIEKSCSFINCSSSHSCYPGTFQNHINGESDLRSTYCALTVCYILNLLSEPLLTSGVISYIQSCQTFEGGFGPEPYCEAHGGYSFCAIASLILLNSLHTIDIKSFIRWLTLRQMIKEGGFNGRTNKLVDSCYSYWQGSIFNMLIMGDKDLSYDSELLYDQLSLQAYILFACQSGKGGLIDKPGKGPDLFHTNYATAGLILSEKCLMDGVNVALSYDIEKEFGEFNPIFGVMDDNVKKAVKYYREKYKE
jgi:protein farnesyltransferase subunit beta